MIAYALKAASESRIFDKIHVSTDSEETKKIVESLGYPVEFMRPPKLAGDTVGTIPVLKWVLNQYISADIFFDDVFNIMPAAPLLESADLVSAYELYLNHKRKYRLHVMTEYPVPVEWACRRDAKGTLSPVSPAGFATRSQDIEKRYYEAGPFSIFNVSHLLSDKLASDGSFISYMMPRDRAIDIDDEQDILLAKKIFLGKRELDRSQ